MTKTVLALSLLFTLPLFAQSPDAGYTINIHVSESRIRPFCGVMNGSSSCVPVRHLSVLINGAKYELESENYHAKAIVALGDYKARLVQDQQKPTHEFNRTDDLMFPDGSTRQFVVTGQLE